MKLQSISPFTFTLTVVGVLLFALLVSFFTTAKAAVSVGTTERATCNLNSPTFERCINMRSDEVVRHGDRATHIYFAHIRDVKNRPLTVVVLATENEDQVDAMFMALKDNPGSVGLSVTP